MLPGGESQRIKLASELAKRDTGRTLYILDEPTTGLHFEDIRQLLDVINRLVDCGNTAIVIEHNLDVIKVADHIIDMGPEGDATAAASWPRARLTISPRPPAVTRASFSDAWAFRQGICDIRA